jgi:hypothetical protein
VHTSYPTGFHKAKGDRHLFVLTGYKQLLFSDHDCCNVL